MSRTRSTGNTKGLFEDAAAMQATSSPVGRRLELYDGSRFQVSAVNDGNGLALTGGNFANPIVTIKETILISTATNLVVGESYISTATASHVVPTASTLGDEIEITWLDGTIMTLTSASNMSVTTDAKVTDTTWVFENFIQTLTLVDTGTEWEIK